MSIKNLFLTNAKILSECECTMYDPVYSTPFQVYYKTAIFNPESHSESYEVLSIKNKQKKNRWTRCFFVSLPCYRRLSSDKPLRRKEGHGTFHISSVAQPPRGRVANQIIINTGIHMGFWGELFSSCIHTSIRLMEIMSFLKPSCLLWTATLYSATVWQQIDSSAFI